MPPRRARGRRSVVALLVLVLAAVAVACDRSPLETPLLDELTGSDPPGAGAAPGTPAAPAPGGGPAGGAPGAPAGGQDAPPAPPPEQGAPPGGGGAAGGQQQTALDDRGPLGAMCRPLLRPGLPRIVLEIDHQAGAEPTAEGVGHLRSVLHAVTGKPVTLAGGNTIPGEGRSWSAESIRAVAGEHRSQHSSEAQGVVYVAALAGSFGDALGVAYAATEFAVFPETMSGLGTLLGGRASLERSVLVHELGHLLCLVNITYASQQNREDPEHPHHSADKASVMYWAIETSAVSQLFDGPPPADFTAADRADLAALANGTY